MNQTSENAATTGHRWKFFRYGGIDQVSLETGADLLALESLDPKLWAAMTCPVENIEFDSKTLEYIDTDDDKRIKIPEVLAALKWVCSVIKNPDDLLKKNENLPISAINTESKEGAQLQAAARQILANLGKETAENISLEDLADTAKIFTSTAFNGDGVVTPEFITDAPLRKLVGEIMECVGSTIDRSGLPGVSEELLDKFLAEAAAFINWQKKVTDDTTGILFAGEKTLEQASAYNAIEAKIDDFFTRCRLAVFDESYISTSQALEKDYIGLLKKNINQGTLELREFPIALMNREMVLPLNDRINPAWEDDLSALVETVIKPVIGETLTLSHKQWVLLKNRFRAYGKWQQEKAGAAVEKLGAARLNEILHGVAADELRQLIAKDKALEPQFAAISSVDKLVRYYRFLYSLLNNFVAFKDFYGRKNKAIFQAGTLYIDSRSCELCVKVIDVAKHSAMANACNTFLVYCDCTKQGSGEKMNIVAAFTDGDSDQLQPGRNGLFIDRKGNYWEATINRIIDHPISIRQAFWAPYKRLSRMIHEQIEKFASAKDKSATDMLSASVNEAGSNITVPAAPVASAPPAPFDIGKFAGIFAAIGLAAAAIGSAISSVVSGFMGLLWWQMPLALAGILLLISGPSMILAGLRLRHRNLGPMLDANGWAINSRAQINMKFGKTLTSIAELPKGSVRYYDDPFAEKKTPWKLYLFLMIVVATLVFVVVNPQARGQARELIHKYFSFSTEESESRNAELKPASSNRNKLPALSTPVSSSTNGL